MTVSEWQEQWPKDHSEVVAFSGILVSAGWLDTARDVVYFFERPDKYANEYTKWLGCGRPDEGDDGWDFFVRKLDQKEEN